MNERLIKKTLGKFLLKEIATESRGEKREPQRNFILCGSQKKL
jgi:hypothetical protein